MMKIEKLRKAGFSLETFEDGKFWVYEPGEEMGKVLGVCRRCIEGFEENSVSDTLVLQCDFDFKNPVLYIDSFLWKLTSRDFADVVQGLGKIRKGKA